MKSVRRSTLSNLWLSVAAGGLSVLLAAVPSAAHEAPSGWHYPPQCCSDQDCRQVDTGEVTVGDGFYKWKDHRIAFNSPKIRRSPDKWFHGCETGFWGDTSGATELLCFFVPAGF